jgi:membrane fusion protein, multidrug efflux system
MSMNAAVDTRIVNGVTVNGTAPAAEPAPTKPSKYRTLVAAGIAVAAALTGVGYIALPGSTESTDNAYIGADATSVAPKVRGLVAAVLVHDNQHVRAGDPLVRIDAEEFDARVATAAADLADAHAGVAAARAALVSLDAEEQLASANVRAAQSSIRASSAQADRAVADRQRFDALVVNGSVSVHDAASVRATAISAEQDVIRSTALLDVSQQQASVTKAKRATLEAQLQKSEATVARARAALELAQQDQRHALILAPIDGVVGNRQVQQGDYVQPGSRLMELVPLQSVYVTANFKETQTERMHVGQRADIRVDAMPDRVLIGTVDSFAPGSGSQFALLPFEPGTGNFTKIVQRVPVRIRFEAGQPALDALRPGLSVTARVELSD